MVTSVDEFQNDVLKLFKKANIESFSSYDIEGYKNIPSVLRTSSWFPGESGANESHLFFSFTDENHIEKLFKLIKLFNKNIETNNPIKAVVLPIEKHI